MQHESKLLNDKVLRVMLFAPSEETTSYNAFASLASKHIIALHFSDSGNFKLWMDNAFQKNYGRLEAYKKDGQFDRQPELKRNPQ